MQAQELLVALASGGMVSGAQLAERAGVTRAAIWKQVEALRARGVPVQSRGTAGYCLPWPVQLLDVPTLRTALPANVRKRLGALELHWEIDSTSSEIQRRQSDLADLSMVLAETQSGRRVYRLTDEGRKELAGDPEGVRRIWQRAERCEDWGSALGPESMTLWPAVAILIRSSMKAASNVGADRVREILDRTRRELEEL